MLVCVNIQLNSALCKVCIETMVSAQKARSISMMIKSNPGNYFVRWENGGDDLFVPIKKEKKPLKIREVLRYLDKFPGEKGQGNLNQYFSNYVPETMNWGVVNTRSLFKEFIVLSKFEKWRLNFYMLDMR